MRRKALLGALVGVVLVLAAGCTSSSSQEKGSTQEQKAYAPHINPTEFTATINNEYLPLKPGTTYGSSGR